MKHSNESFHTYRDWKCYADGLNNGMEMPISEGVWKLSILIMMIGAVILESISDGICNVMEWKYKRTHNKRIINWR